LELNGLKLKGLFAFEIAAVTIAIAVIMLFVEVTPYLASSKPSSQIGVYNQKEFAKGDVTLSIGQTTSAQFNYSTYDPAILVVDLTFQDWRIPGYLSFYCNGRLITTINATPDNPQVRLNVISVSGWDWVKPPSLNSFTYGNEVTFVSEPENGFEGTFSYQIDIRGSR
jgi:hypothetical protein